MKAGVPREPPWCGLKASDALRRESDLLRAEIDAFLTNIRAA